MKDFKRFSFLLILFFSPLISCAETLDQNKNISKSGKFKVETKFGEGETNFLRVFDLREKKYLNLPYEESDISKPKFKGIADITAYIWINDGKDDVLLYSVSPIYGKPGIFAFFPNKIKTTKVLKPKTINESYPDGEDYFELVKFEKGVIYYKYSKDVDSKSFQDDIKKINKVKFEFGKMN